MDEFIFRIKRMTDGKYSKGGGNPKFSKFGKIWTSEGYLKSHLTLVKECGHLNEYDNCQVFKYRLDLNSNESQIPIDFFRHGCPKN